LNLELNRELNRELQRELQLGVFAVVTMLVNGLKTT
jgi:hypothetical protein